MKKKLLFIILFLLPMLILGVCFLKLNKKTPTTLTLWHNYGGQLKNIMDEMVDEFNDTVGKKEGLLINVTSISGSATLHEKLTMAANEDPGAPQLPDITCAYPKTATLLAEKELLVNLDNLFTDKELSAYLPKFLEEGRLLDGSLYVFPTAKSTEVLFVNTTIFNRFAEETGASIDDLKTFEGIFHTAKLYYEWTDGKTPDIPNDGKAFYVADSLFHFSYLGCKQLNSNLLFNNKIDFDNEAVKNVWENYYISAIKGSYALFDGYATDLAKTGEIVCSTGSTAGVAFLSPTVTYPNNTIEDAVYEILPYPTFKNGKKIAIQRGAGMCITKSNKEKERLAGIFIKWFTSPENNLRFVSTTGYLPVTEEAFGDILLNEIHTITDDNIKRLLNVSREMQMNYEFFVIPTIEGMDQIESVFNTDFKSFSSLSKAEYEASFDTLQTKEALQNFIHRKYIEFTSNIMNR